MNWAGLFLAHMDCEKARRFGWHERAERFVAAVLSRTFATAPGAFNLFNACTASSSRGCERGQWRYFGRPTWHCMESDGRATVVYVPRQSVHHAPSPCVFPRMRWAERFDIVNERSGTCA
jgi:hypothetical protein